jgi:hypothetical protein
MNPDWVTAIASILAVIVAFFGLVVANKQLGGLRKSLQMNSLMAVLAIETELSSKKEKCDEVATALKRARTQSVDSREVEILSRSLDSAVENWLNTMERLCFCIGKGYVSEKDWRAEYRQYIAEAIRSQSHSFQAGTPYKHILRLHEKWSAE